MDIFFAILLKEHINTGLLFTPYLIGRKDDQSYIVKERITIDNIEHYHQYLSDGHKELVKEVDEYNDQNLRLRFSKKKIATHLFLQKVDKRIIADHIRPFIERRMAAAFEMIVKEKVRIFHYKTRNVVYKNEEILPMKELAEVIFNFIRQKEQTLYFQTILYNGRMMELKDKDGIILTNKPCLLLLNDKIYKFSDEVDGNKLKVFFNKDYISIPSKFEENYYKRFVKKCLRDYNVRFEGFKVNKPEVRPKAQISIEDDIFGLPCFFIKFRYDEVTVDPIKNQRRIVIKTRSEPPAFKMIDRDPEWEEDIFNYLNSIGLKKLRENNFSISESNDGSENQEVYSLVNWLNKNASKLKNRGFMIEQSLDGKTFFTGDIELKLDVSEKNDWFDVMAMVHFGDEFQIPLMKLRKHLLNGIREYILPDDRIAVLPEEWFKKYTDLVSFGEKSKQKIKLSKMHSVILEDTLSDSAYITRKTFNSLIYNRKKRKPALPAEIKATLRPYQIEGFHWLSFLSDNKLGGCLADDMGLGKTLQTLCLLTYHTNKQQKRTQKQTGNKDRQIDLFGNTDQDVAYVPSLVIMPASLIHNWINEIRKFVPGLLFLNYTGPQRKDGLSSFHRIPIILTTYGTIRNDFNELENQVFDYIILDESQAIKNPSSKIAKTVRKLKSNYKLVLSGTPIENSLTDLWSQMAFLNPGLLGDLKFFRKYFLKPIEKNIDQDKLEKLRLLVKPYILRRTKSQVEKDLPELSEEVIWCEMTPDQSEQYEKEKIRARNLIFESYEEEGGLKNSVVVMRALSRLRQIACHPSMLENENQFDSGKFNEVMRNIETLISEGHKILVFSSFVRHLEIYRRYFDENNVSYAIMTGESTKREEIINTFKTDSRRNVFLISLKTGGVGLNLTEAGYVFMLDPWWNAAAEMQAINRAHRIGQNKPVFAYRFITKNSIEEKILKLQEKKAGISRQFISAENPLNDLNLEDLKKLI